MESGSGFDGTLTAAHIYQPFILGDAFCPAIWLGRKTQFSWKTEPAVLIQSNFSIGWSQKGLSLWQEKSPPVRCRTELGRVDLELRGEHHTLLIPRRLPLPVTFLGGPDGQPYRIAYLFSYWYSSTLRSTLRSTLQNIDIPYPPDIFYTRRGGSESILRAAGLYWVLG